jgi:hypothetical protein
VPRGMPRTGVGVAAGGCTLGNGKGSGVDRGAGRPERKCAVKVAPKVPERVCAPCPTRQQRGTGMRVAGAPARTLGLGRVKRKAGLGEGGAGTHGHHTHQHRQRQATGRHGAHAYGTRPRQRGVSRRASRQGVRRGCRYNRRGRCCQGGGRNGVRAGMIKCVAWQRT